MLDSLRLDGRVAVVTGASSGLGMQFARALHDGGATVIGAARRKDRLDALADELPRFTPAPCDVSIAGDRVAVIDEVVRRHGAIDVLVNNAGITSQRPAEAERLEEFREVIDVDLVAVAHLAQLAAAQMLPRRRGAIVNVASVYAFGASGKVPQASYVAAKHAVVGLTREHAVQWASRGIRVNALCPGFFLTELTADHLSGAAAAAFLRARVPMQRPGAVGELDAALLFLASDASSYVTGSTLLVYGGYTAA